MSEFPQIDVSSWPRDREEPTGQGAKHWLEKPEGGGLWLFKSRKRRPSKLHGTDWSGDDWAERICSELYQLVGVPRATVELATDARYSDESDTRGLGVITRNLAGEGAELVLGNAFLAGLDPDYPREKNRGDFYTLDRVLEALKDTKPAVGSPDDLPAQTGDCVFVGYLVMDALTCGSDRNHTNWGVIRGSNDKTGGYSLAGSFDHGSSLGWNLQDATREAGLNGDKPSQAPEKYLRRGEGVFARSGTGAERMGPLEALEVAATLRGDAFEYWLDRLSRVDVDELMRVTQRIPADRISRPSHDYAQQLIRLGYASLMEMR